MAFRRNRDLQLRVALGGCQFCWCKQRRGTHLLVVEPVMNLELDPCRSKQVQRRRGDESPFLARHEPIADHARVGRHEFLFRGLAGELAWEVSAESHRGAAHERTLQRVELAIRVARSEVSLIRERGVCCVALGYRGGVSVVEVELAQLKAEDGEIEGAEEAGEFVPGDDFVDETEEIDSEVLSEVGLEGLEGVVFGMQLVVLRQF